MIPTSTPNNYVTWSIKIEMVLIRAEIFDVVDGLFVVSSSIDPTNHTLWKSKDAKARVDILFHCCEKKLLTLSKLKIQKQFGIN
jgi:hypothetical protein